MQSPAKIDLYADRNVLFGVSFGFFEKDFTGASFAMKVRQEPDEGGTALITLGTTTSSTAEGVRRIYAGSDTIANHIAAGRTTAAKAAKAGYALTDTVLLSVVGVRILAATMALAAYPSDELGDNLPLAYDLLITPSGGDADKYVYGAFIVRGTVTF
jgi:hypothetical protein